MTPRQLEGSIVTITGGTGSFGSTMARPSSSKGIAELRVFSRDESKQDAMRHAPNDRRCATTSATFAMPPASTGSSGASDLVFHAAALKQVPSCEFFPLEAVATNVPGSANVIQAALDSRREVGRLPEHRQGRLPDQRDGHDEGAHGEDGDGARPQPTASETVVSVTRYGNVMYSRGSVIPLFLEQLGRGRTADGHRPGDDPFPHVARGVGRPRRIRIHRGDHRGPLRAQGAGDARSNPAPAVANIAGVAGPRSSDRRPPWGEALRVPAEPEELAHAEDCGDYFRVPLDTRALDYRPSSRRASRERGADEAYTSHNTTRLGVDEVEALLDDAAGDPGVSRRPLGGGRERASRSAQHRAQLHATSHSSQPRTATHRMAPAAIDEPRVEVASGRGPIGVADHLAPCAVGADGVALEDDREAHQLRVRPGAPGEAERASREVSSRLRQPLGDELAEPVTQDGEQREVVSSLPDVAAIGHVHPLDRHRHDEEGGEERDRGDQCTAAQDRQRTEDQCTGGPPRCSRRRVAPECPAIRSCRPSSGRIRASRAACR